MKNDSRNPHQIKPGSISTKAIAVLLRALIVSIDVNTGHERAGSHCAVAAVFNNSRT